MTPRLRTSDDPTGKLVLGTLNNCAMGFTPWGTYLTCEENFNGFFFRTTATPDRRTPLEKRYGISPFGSGLRLHTTHPRFNADIEPNEPNRFGWVVEIDPFNPKSTPVKRTALGRIKHEGAWVQETKDGKIVVYMGDDERNEYIYRYVSNLPWRVARRRGINPLDDGILYVARFNADGTGDWLPLTPDNPALAGRSLNDILINTRAAADAVGATMMDRPEWIDTFPKALTAIATLTNNNRRGTTPVSVNNPDGSTTAGSARPAVDAINPRVNNVYGHIITWKYDKDWTEPDFEWDIFALSGDPRGAGPWLGHRRRQIRFARRHLCRAERQALDRDRRVDLDDQHRRLCRLRQQPDAVRRSGNRRDSPLPRWPETVRDHRRVHDSRREDDVRRHPAPRRDTRRLAHRSSQSQGVKLLARWRRRRTAAIGVHRDHERRRRGNRQLIPEARGPRGHLFSPRGPAACADRKFSATSALWVKGNWRR